MEIAKSSDWFSLGTSEDKCYYRIWDLYKNQFSINLEDYNLFISPYSGLVAQIHDYFHLCSAGREISFDPTIYITNIAGYNVCRYSYTTWAKQTIISGGWTNHDDLLLILEDGTLLKYNLFTSTPEKVLLLPELSNDMITTGYIGINDCVVSTTQNKVYYITIYPDIKCKFNIQIDIPQNLTIMSCIIMSQDGPVLAAVTNDTNIFMIDNQSISLLTMKDMKDIIRAKISPNNNMCIFQTKTSIIVYSNDFSSIILNKSINDVNDIYWCGSDAIILISEGIFSLLGPTGDCIDFPYEVYDSPTFATIEDGLWIITTEKIQFLSKVPLVCATVQSIGSTSPGSILYDLSQELQQDNIRSIHNIITLLDDEQLSLAIQQCLEISLHEFNPFQQLNYLRAANYGKLSLLNDYSYDISNITDQIKETCQILRIFNTIREDKIGLCTTYDFYRQHGINYMINILLKRQLFSISLSISNYMQINNEKIYISWGIHLITTSLPTTNDDYFIDKIRSHLRKLNSVSYTKLVLAAYETHRLSLALRLLEFEPNVKAQLDLLIHMDQIDLALKRLEKEPDTDILFRILYELFIVRKSKYSLLKNSPRCTRYFLSYLSNSKPELVGKYCEELEIIDPNHLVNVKSQLSPSDITYFLAFYKNNHNLFELFNEHQDLIEVQNTLNSKIKATNNINQVDLSNLSLRDTIIACVENNYIDVSLKLKDKYKLNELSYYYARIEAYGNKQEFQKLLRFFSEAKSPIGAEPFAYACWLHGSGKDSLHYIGFISDPKERFEFYIKTNQYIEALNYSVECRSIDFLTTLQLIPGDPSFKRNVEKAIKSIQ